MRRKALLSYNGDRTGTPSVPDVSMSIRQPMAASPTVRAGARTPGTASWLRRPASFGQEAATGPIEPFRTHRRLESTLAEAEAWVGRRVRSRTGHLLPLCC